MKVLVTGSAGYVASKLIPALLQKGHGVHGIDIAGKDKMEHAITGRVFSEYCGDIRDINLVRSALQNCDAVIHLACLSNDPTCDLDPALTKSINLDSFAPLVKASKEAGVRRFILASSSSVYGVKTEKHVTEDMSLEPLTDYSRYKAMCEQILLAESGIERVVIRPATICGYAPSMRLDLLVHILTMSAIRNGVINVHGGHQYRPNIHIDDMVDAYIALLEAPAERVDGQVFNCGTENLTILQTAELIKDMMGRDTPINITPSTDPRSYHVDSTKIMKELWQPKKSVRAAIREIAVAYLEGQIPDPEADRYYRIRGIKNLGLAA